MPTYTIIPQADQTFQVAIVGDDGARQTLLGFETQADAEAWIAWDRRQSADNEPRVEGDLRPPLPPRRMFTGGVPWPARPEPDDGLDLPSFA